MGQRHAHLVLTALAALAACGGADLVRVPRSAPERPPIVESLDAPIVFGPVAHPATAYDEALPAPAADAPAATLADELLAGLRPLLGEATPAAHDARLDLAAAELAGVARRDAPISDELVEFALHTHGVVERGHAVIARGASSAELAAALAPLLHGKIEFANTRLGLGGGDGLAVAIVAYTIPVTFTAFPREVHGATVLAGTLAAPSRAASITVTRADRTIDHLAVTLDGAGGFRAPFACSGQTGTQWVSIEVDDNATPLALLPVSCDAPPPATFSLESRANLATTDYERRLTAMINRERIAAHVGPLITDAGTTTAARRYALAMQRTLDVAHDLDNTTTVSRLQAAGRMPVLVSEATLRADDFAQATEILLNDPLYRQQVATASASHIGVGVVVGHNGALFVAIDYILIPPPIDHAKLEAAAMEQIAAAHHTRRTGYKGAAITRYLAGPPLVDDDLTGIARQFAARLALGQSAPAIHARMKRTFVDAEARYSHIANIIVPLTDPDRLDVRALFPEGMVVDNIGLAVAQAPRESLGTGRFWLVIVYARYDH